MLKLFFLFLIMPNFLFAQKYKDSLILPELIPYKIGRKFGYCNRDMKLIINAKFDQATPFMVARLTLNNKRTQKFETDEYATVKIKNKLFRIDKKGKTVYKIRKQYPLYKSADDNNYKYKNFVFIENNKVGIKGPKATYPDWNNRFKGDSLQLLRNIDGNVGYEIINRPTDTIIIIPALYDKIESAYTSINKEPFIAKMNSKFGLLGFRNVIIAEFKYDLMQFVHVPNLLFVRINDDEFYIDFNGKEYR